VVLLGVKSRYQQGMFLLFPETHVELTVMICMLKYLRKVTDVCNLL
jgi:hypothetical protein